jgi:hypothetical protein
MLTSQNHLDQVNQLRKQIDTVRQTIEQRKQQTPQTLRNTEDALSAYTLWVEANEEIVSSSLNPHKGEQSAAAAAH